MNHESHEYTETEKQVLLVKPNDPVYTRSLEVVITRFNPVVSFFRVFRVFRGNHCYSVVERGV